MQLVEDDVAQMAEVVGGIGVRDHQRDLLRGGDEDVGRIALLAGAARLRRIAGARFDADVEPHLGDRCFQIARDVDGERLERRDIQHLEITPAPALGQLDEGGQEPGQRLAAAGRRDQQHRTAGARLSENFQLMRPRPPAARREPGGKTLRQSGRRGGGSGNRGHG